MVGVSIAADQFVVNIPEGLPVSELVKIMKASIRALNNEELRAMQVKKNQIYNPKTLKRQLNHHNFEDLTRKLTKYKLMKFVAIEPERFHPILWRNSTRRSLLLTTSPSKWRFTTQNLPYRLSFWRRNLDSATQGHSSSHTSMATQTSSGSTIPVEEARLYPRLQAWFSQGISWLSASHYASYYQQNYCPGHQLQVGAVH